MNIFKIVLTVLILLQTIQIIPSTNININNEIQKMFIILFIILLSMVEPTIALLITILVTINTKNIYIEKLFTPLNNTDLKNIMYTIHIEGTSENQHDKKQPDKKQPDKKQPDKKHTDKKQPDKKQPDKKQPDKKQPDKKQPDKKQPDKKQKMNTETKKEMEYDKDLIISESMLHNIQNNVFDEKNMSKYPNETNDVNVNIQGVFNSINGYSSPPY